MDTTQIPAKGNLHILPQKLLFSESWNLKLFMKFHFKLSLETSNNEVMSFCFLKKIILGLRNDY